MSLFWPHLSPFRCWRVIVLDGSPFRLSPFRLVVVMTGTVKPYGKGKKGFREWVTIFHIKKNLFLTSCRASGLYIISIDVLTAFIISPVSVMALGDHHSGTCSTSHRQNFCITGSVTDVPSELYLCSVNRRSCAVVSTSVMFMF